jgi:hypothetical protein
LLDERGRPRRVEANERIEEEQEIRPRGRRIVVRGLKTADERLRAINLDVASFTFALRELGRLPLRQGETPRLYSCAHGTPGFIELDSFQVPNISWFQGFQTLPNFPNGTNVILNNLRYPPYPARPVDQQLQDLPATHTPIEAFLHHCFTEVDPDGAGNAQHSVVATLAAKEVMVQGQRRRVFNALHGHPNFAEMLIFLDADRDATVLMAPAQVQGQVTEAINEAVRRFDLVRHRPLVQGELPRLSYGPFPRHYDTVQAAIDFSLGRRGLRQFIGHVFAHLTYGDTGDVMINALPRHGARRGCSRVAGFLNAHGQLQLAGPLGTEVVSLSGPMEIHFDPTTLRDTDQDGLEEVQAEIGELNLSGTSASLGPVTLRRREIDKTPGQPSVGQLREMASIASGRLDVPPFCDASAEPACAGATAESTFDLFFELEAPNTPFGALLLHTGEPKHLQATLSADQPGEGDTYQNFDVFPLLDEADVPSGIEVGPASFTPSPAVSLTGSAIRVGVIPDPGRDAGAKVGMTMKFTFAGSVNLGASILTLHSLLDEFGGAGELLPNLPLLLSARVGGKPNFAIFETPSRALPKVRVEIQTKGQNIYDFLLRVERTTISAFPQRCAGEQPATTLLATRFTIQDNVNRPVEIGTVRPWRCSDLIGGDPQKPRSLRVP